ncbi:MAG: chorismate synthase [Phycisphaerales bacterium]|nr:chorismate synthase [Phycisphaerales bacterium]
MSDIRIETAGESHGPCGTALITGLPAGIVVDEQFINAELKRRQGGYGRGGRQRIESDHVVVTAGVRLGLTTGAPVVLQVPNADSRLDDLERTPPMHRPRPGHADLSGSLKYGTDDCRNILERASARETAVRTAAGALCRLMLRELGIETFGYLRGLLDIDAPIVVSGDLNALREQRDASEVYNPDAEATASMIEHIRQAKVDKDTIGGVCEVHVLGCPAGLGTCMERNHTLDSSLAGAVMSIQAFKGVEIGLGFGAPARCGSQVHDPIEHDGSRYTRPTNNAGGIEGGMTNGMPVVIRGAMKPISTLLRGLPSVDMRTLEAQQSTYERSDVCASPAASVVMEHVVASVVAAAVCSTFGGDTMDDIKAAMERHVG